MKKIAVIVLALLWASLAQAQTVIENFDSNTLGWSEYNDSEAVAAIENGYLSVESDTARTKDSGENDFITFSPAGMGIGFSSSSSKEYTVGLSTCWAPIDQTKPFRIKTVLTYDENDAFFWVLFNMKDPSVCYSLGFCEDKNRVFLGTYSGEFVQGLEYPSHRDKNLEIVIEGDGADNINCWVNGKQVFSARYMPCEYDGFGFRTQGEQEIHVDMVEFTQL